MLASTPSTPSRRGTNTTFLGLSTLLLATLAFLMTLSSASASPTAIRQRDAFTDVRGTARDASLTSIGTRPSGAYARSIPITSASSIFTWYSKTPHNEADAESAFIIIHGIDRNANTYWTSLNNAWAKARDAGYGINKYTAPYGSLSSSRAPSLFRAYAAKEVRYVVGLADTTSEDGDQSCMAHAAGGQKRRNRSLAYWKYIHLLSGGTDPDRVKNFPGTFPALDAKYGKTSQKNIPQSSSTVANRFRGVGVRHSLTTIDGVGHSATQIYGSDAGRNALFADQASSGSGNVPDLSKELNGFNATKAGAIDYGAGGGSSN
ncbi:hypothetical protein NDA16_003082 [Ustilago loliicola]|nr:hypothetical protein NDA16_003082 [Ustilago loliicola]